MTVQELLSLLENVPKDAQVLVFDGHKSYVTPIINKESLRTVNEVPDVWDGITRAWLEDSKYGHTIVTLPALSHGQKILVIER